MGLGMREIQLRVRLQSGPAVVRQQPADIGEGLSQPSCGESNH